jgi:hypothetical protein
MQRLAAQIPSVALHALDLSRGRAINDHLRALSDPRAAGQVTVAFALGEPE